MVTYLISVGFVLAVMGVGSVLGILLGMVITRRADG